MKCQIVERFKDYTPPCGLTHVVGDLLRCVPPEYLAGLHAVVLTNEAAQSRSERRRSTYSRKRKVRLADCRGFYHPGPEPFIQLHVDVILAKAQRFNANSLRKRIAVACIRPVSLRMKLGAVLYHEVGHHVHLSLRPEEGHEETMADRYGWDLLFGMMKRRWYLNALGVTGLFLLPEELYKMAKQTKGLYAKCQS